MRGSAFFSAVYVEFVECKSIVFRKKLNFYFSNYSVFLLYKLYKLLLESKKQMLHNARPYGHGTTYCLDGQ